MTSQEQSRMATPSQWLPRRSRCTLTQSRAPKEKREFYIPRLNREQSLFGTDLEIRLRNELTQKAIAQECADWIRSKATFKSFEGEEGMGITALTVDKPGDTVSYMPL